MKLCLQSFSSFRNIVTSLAFILYRGNNKGADQTERMRRLVRVIVVCMQQSGPEVIKLLSCSTQVSTKIILLINVKMPTIVGILTFISMINTTSERLKARNFFICQYFSFYEQLKFRDRLRCVL